MHIPRYVDIVIPDEMLLFFVVFSLAFSLSVHVFQQVIYADTLASYSLSISVFQRTILKIKECHTSEFQNQLTLLVT